MFLEENTNTCLRRQVHAGSRVVPQSLTKSSESRLVERTGTNAISYCEAANDSFRWLHNCHNTRHIGRLLHFTLIIMFPAEIEDDPSRFQLVTLGWPGADGLCS